MPAKLVSGMLLLFILVGPLSASAAAIDATNHYAWNDNGGWVNWNPTNGNVSVTDTALTGYIWSADFGWINLSPTNGGVTNNGQGVLGGYAWGQNSGWISFTGVTIDINGIFHGSTVAQSVFGTMTFDCTNCLVQTTWRSTTSSGGSTSSAGGNGAIVNSGPLSVGYRTPTPTSSSQTAPATLPASLVPNSPPPSVEPKTKPSKSTLQPSQLAAGITIAISAPSSVSVGTPLPVSVNIMSSAQRLGPIAISYQLYPASGIVAYGESGKIAPTEPLQFVQSIPTGTITPDDYVLAVTAAYGSLPSVTQTLHVSVLASTPAIANPAPAPNNTYVGPKQCSPWFGACMWKSVTDFFSRLFAF
jgi:hypothetical protein